MILCLKCNRIWGKGTVFCGSCGGTLGCKLCPDGHSSLSSCKFCSTCGSSKLTNYVPCLSLRFVSWLLVGIAPVAVGFVASRTSVQFVNLNVEALKERFLLCLIFGGLIYFAIYLVFGKKTARLVLRCFQMSISLALRILSGSLRFLLNHSKPKRRVA